MDVLIDTNVLLRMVQFPQPLNKTATNAVDALFQRGDNLVITPQIVAEFWNVATRPNIHNGLGLSHDEARKEVTAMERIFALIYETPDVYNEWKRLVADYGVSGVQVHDARLVAAMNVYGILQVLTFNGSDFARYRDIDVLNPKLLIST